MSGAAPAVDPARTDEAYARELDAADPLAALRERFHLPPGADGTPKAYFCGNSLGLQPKDVRRLLEEELDDWATLAVDGHFEGRRPWYAYHERFRAPLARLVGARPGEVVAMNSLTVNLHLLMVSFYRPEGRRRKVLMETPAFPSDIYAIRTHVRTRGLDPDADVIVVGPRAGEQALRDEDLLAAIREAGDELALVLLGGVNFLTGQRLDMEAITAAGHDVGAIVGFDLAHAAGNVPLRLHDWGADFASWCSYKYLNGGPGAVSAVFIHERHASDPTIPRYGGWWGNDPELRFRMHLESEFVAKADADGWQLSNPPVLALTPLIASLALFDEAGMDALRERSLRLTPYLRGLLSASAGDWFELVTPTDPDRHGCQLSLRVTDRPRERFESLVRAGVVGDFREPDVIRLAPAPLYNSFHDCWRCAAAIAGA